MNDILTDIELEKLWKELGDIPFIEDEDLELILDVDWYIFSKGTTREEIWHWFDKKHSRGVYYLLEEYESEEN